MDTRGEDTQLSRDKSSDINEVQIVNDIKPKLRKDVQTISSLKQDIIVLK